MRYRLKLTQGEMEYMYTHGKGRTATWPEVEARHLKVLSKATIYKTEKEALKAAIKIEKTHPLHCQVWAKIELIDGIYQLSDYWVASDDIYVLIAAEYIGMAQVYTDEGIQGIVDDKIDVDEIIAYYYNKA